MFQIVNILNPWPGLSSSERGLRAILFKRSRAGKSCLPGDLFVIILFFWSGWISSIVIVFVLFILFVIDIISLCSTPYEYDCNLNCYFHFHTSWKSSMYSNVFVSIGFILLLISNFAFTVSKLKFGTLRFTAVIILLFCRRCKSQVHFLAPPSLRVFIIYLIQPPATHLIL